MCYCRLIELKYLFRVLLYTSCGEVCILFKIALCDDNLVFLDTLKTLLVSIFQKTQHEVNYDVFQNGKELIKAVEHKKITYNMIFLDIQMPDIDGFKVAERLRQLDESFILLFTTHMQALVKKGYRYNAFRYIDKNHINEEVSEAINTLLKKHDNKAQSQRSIEFKFNNRQVYEAINVPENEIIMLYKKGRAVYLITIYSEYMLLKYNLEKYKELIGGSNFIIVSRSYLLNLGHINTIMGDYFILSNGKSISIGSTPGKVNELKLVYGKYRKGMI